MIINKLKKYFMPSKLEILNFFLQKWNVNAFRNQNIKDIDKIIEFFHPVKTKYKLIRVGETNDGGYLLPDILNQIKFCLSAGVGNTCLFEKQLEEKNIISYLNDYSIPKPPNELKISFFEKKFINSYNSEKTLNVNSWINRLIKDNNLEIYNSILKIDTEGAEYEILPSLDENFLKEFKILVIEFHNLEFLGNEIILQLMSSIKKKILKYFLPIHIHANNSSKLHNIYNLKVPSAIEVTYLNKKLIDTYSPINEIPNKLDSKNVIKNQEIKLPIYWYKK